jgi:hypothetical protein
MQNAGELPDAPNNAFGYLSEELRNDFKVVSSPEPDTLRVQLAIVEAEPSSRVRNVISSVVPIGIGISAIKGAGTGKQTGVGEITAEFKVSDAVTGELLGAAIRPPRRGKDVSGMYDSWYNADARAEILGEADALSSSARRAVARTA